MVVINTLYRNNKFFTRPICINVNISHTYNVEQNQDAEKWHDITPFIYSLKYALQYYALINLALLFM